MGGTLVLHTDLSQRRCKLENEGRTARACLGAPPTEFMLEAALTDPLPPPLSRSVSHAAFPFMWNCGFQTGLYIVDLGCLSVCSRLVDAKPRLSGQPFTLENSR